MAFFSEQITIKKRRLSSPIREREREGEHQSLSLSPCHPVLHTQTLCLCLERVSCVGCPFFPRSGLWLTGWRVGRCREEDDTEYFRIVQSSMMRRELTSCYVVELSASHQHRARREGVYLLSCECSKNIYSVLYMQCGFVFFSFLSSNFTN